MEKYFTENGINITKTELEKFNSYFELLTTYNEKFNITAITDKKEVYIKNFVDSLLFLDKFSGKTLIDIGSGGGFPALPIKIMKSDLNVTLVEATGKKCEFLRVVVNELKLKNVEIINARAEELAFNPKYRENFDLCSARAVARLNVLAEYCMPFVKIGGKFIAFKALCEEEVKEGLSAINTLSGKLIGCDKKPLYENTRTCVVVEKMGKCDKLYPRTNGKIRKKPL